MSSRNNLCQHCQETLKNKVIVDANFFKYLIVKAEITEDELVALQKEKPIYASYKDHKHFTKQNSTITPPSFKADKKFGEGKASQIELSKRQEMLDRYKETWDKINKTILPNKNLSLQDKLPKIKGATDIFGMQLKNIMDRYIPTIWDNNIKLAEDNLTKIGITVQERPEKRNEVFNALMAWQKFRMEMNADMVYWTVGNKLLGNNYFVVAYGKK